MEIQIEKGVRFRHFKEEDLENYFNSGNSFFIKKQ